MEYNKYQEWGQQRYGRSHPLTISLEANPSNFASDSCQIQCQQWKCQQVKRLLFLVPYEDQRRYTSSLVLCQEVLPPSSTLLCGSLKSAKECSPSRQCPNLIWFFLQIMCHKFEQEKSLLSMRHALNQKFAQGPKWSNQFGLHDHLPVLDRRCKCPYLCSLFGGGGTNMLNAARNVETEFKGRLFAMTLVTWPWVANDRDGWSRRRPTIDSFVSYAAILSARRLFRVVAQGCMTVAPVTGFLIGFIFPTGTSWQTTRGWSNPAAIILPANSSGSVCPYGPFMQIQWDFSNLCKLPFLLFFTSTRVLLRLPTASFFGAVLIIKAPVSFLDNLPEDAIPAPPQYLSLGLH